MTNRQIMNMNILLLWFDVPQKVTRQPEHQETAAAIRNIFLLSEAKQSVCGTAWKSSYDRSLWKNANLWDRSHDSYWTTWFASSILQDPILCESRYCVFLDYFKTLWMCAGSCQIDKCVIVSSTLFSKWCISCIYLAITPPPMQVDLNCWINSGLMSSVYATL